MAEPSSKSSSTMPTADSFLDSLLVEPWDFVLKKKDRSLLCFLRGGDGGGIVVSGGIMSTTIQVVSSLNPLVLNAS